MSRDKYSDDHTIRVDEGTGTLTVEGNVTVDGDFTYTGQLDLDSLELSNAVTQRVRYPGCAFRPDDGETPTTDFGYTISSGRLTFTGTAAYCFAPITEIPHGATITQIRVYGIADGASDSVTLTLRETDGTQLSSVSISNAGASDVGNGAALSYKVDYTNNVGLFLRVYGIAGTTSASILFADVGYTIQKFPQDSESTPA